jgi:hypothetical protein
VFAQLRLRWVVLEPKIDHRRELVGQGPILTWLFLLVDQPLPNQGIFIVEPLDCLFRETSSRNQSAIKFIACTH